MLDFLQGGVVLAISVAALVGAVWALVDALRRPNQAFVAAGRHSKALWGVILGVAAVIAFVSLPWPLGTGGGIIGLLGVATIIAVVFYFVDVRPKLGGSGSSRGGQSRGGW